jgi:hypothetical protein
VGLVALRQILLLWHGHLACLSQHRNSQARRLCHFTEANTRPGGAFRFSLRSQREERHPCLSTAWSQFQAGHIPDWRRFCIGAKMLAENHFTSCTAKCIVAPIKPTQSTHPSMRVLRILARQSWQRWMLKAGTLPQPAAAAGGLTFKPMGKIIWPNPELNGRV